MNVALLIESLSVHGGTHKQLLRLAQYLRASGDRVEIVTREYLPGQCYEEFGGFDIKTDPTPLEAGWAEWPRASVWQNSSARMRMCSTSTIRDAT